MATRGPKVKPIRHGTAYAYSTRKCHCTECSAAWAAKARADKERRMSIGLAPGDPRHGTPYGYTQWGCRKACCTDAWAAYCAQLHSEVSEGI